MRKPPNCWACFHVYSGSASTSGMWTTLPREVRAQFSVSINFDRIGLWSIHEGSRDINAIPRNRNFHPFVS